MTNAINFNQKSFTTTFLCFVALFFSSFNASAQCGVNLSGAIPTGVYSGAMTLSGNITIASGVVADFNGLTLSANATTRTITVQAGGTLIIQNSSILDVCSPITNWVGVRVNANGTLTMSNSTIKSATIGVSVLNGVLPALFSITNSNFSNNTTGVSINAFAGAHPGLLNGNTFVGNTAGTGTGLRITGPTTSTLSLSVFNGNSFSWLTTGVVTTNSVDYGLNGGFYSNISSIGVNTANTAAGSPVATATIRNCGFSQIATNGIYMNGRINQNIMVNQFAMMPTTSTSVRSLNANSNSIMIANNSFTNFANGILVNAFTNCLTTIQGNNFNQNPTFTSVSCTANTGSNVVVQFNTFNNGTDGKTAINMVNSGTAAGPILINANKISNYENGILCSALNSLMIDQVQNRIMWGPTSSAAAHYGIKNSTCTNLNVKENDVQMLSTAASAFTGIYHLNCDLVTIRCNHVMNGTTSLPNHFGYDFVKNTATSFTTCIVDNNEDKAMAIGFRFTATPLGTYPITFTNNRMDSDGFGLRLSNWGIGNQGVVGSTPCFNRWWGCGIQRTPAATPIPTFFTNGPGLPVAPELAVPTGGCLFASYGGPLLPFVSPCLSPILFKTEKENDTNITAIEPLTPSVETIETTPNITTTKHDLNDKFYPNPVQSMGFYEIELADNESGTIALYDLQGRILTEKSLNNGFNKVEFSLDEIPNGMYLYKLSTNNNLQKIGRFVVQH